MCVKLSHSIEQQILAQYCKSTTLQFKKWEKKRNISHLI